MEKAQFKTKKAILFSLLSFIGLNLILQVYFKSLTLDEQMHIAAGLSYLKDWKISINVEHPPLVKVISSIFPYLANEISLPSYNDFKPYKGWSLLLWSIDSIKTNFSNLDLLTFETRIFPILLTLILGYLIYKAAKELFGEVVGLIALFIYCFEPTFLGHGKLVHTDVPSALFYFWYFYTLYKIYNKPCYKGFIYLSIIFGLAIVTKFSMLILVPTYLFVVVNIIFKKDWKRYCKILPLMAFIPWFIIATLYFFRISRLSENEARLLIKWLYLPTECTTYLNYFFRYIPIYLPPAFLKGIDMVWEHNHLGHFAYLLGHHSQKGWWYYFPVALCLKENLLILVVFFLGLVYALIKVLKDKKFLFIIFPIFYYSVFAFTSHINIGIRHYLPVFPFLIIGASIFLERIFNRGNWPRLAILIFLFLIAFETVRTFPHYISYFNQLVGENGWRMLSDSNTEWGQDIKELARFCHRKNIKFLQVYALNAWLLPYYGIGISLFRPIKASFMETPGNNKKLFLLLEGENKDAAHYLALGTSCLTLPPQALLPLINFAKYQQIERVISEFRSKEPWTKVGKTIFLYKIK